MHKWSVNILCGLTDASGRRMASAGMREFKIGQYVYYRPRNRGAVRCDEIAAAGER
jgi:hypothetical protein